MKVTAFNKGEAKLHSPGPSHCAGSKPSTGHWRDEHKHIYRKENKGDKVLKGSFSVHIAPQTAKGIIQAARDDVMLLCYSVEEPGDAPWSKRKITFWDEKSWNWSWS